MALRTRVNNAPASLQVTTAWTPALASTGAFLTTDQLYWNGVTGTNATTTMGGAINVGGAGGGVAVGPSQTVAVTINNGTAVALTLGTNGISASLAGANLTIGPTNTVVLGANQTWNINTGRIITVSSQMTGTGTLAKAGAGELFLTGTGNTNSGAVTASAGNLHVAGYNFGTPNQLAAAASITLSGGILFINGNTAYATFSTPISGANDAYVTNTASGGVTFTGTALTGYNGSLRLYTDSGNGAATTQKVTSNVWNFGNFYFYTGSGLTGSRSQTLTYNGTPALSYGGPLFVLPGSGTGIAAKVENLSTNTLTLTNVTQNLASSAFTTTTLEYAATNGVITQSASIQDTSTGSMGFIKSGTNDVTLTGDNTFRGAVTVNNGTLNANSATALGAASSTAAISVTSSVGAAVLSLGTAVNYPSRSVSVSGALVIAHGTPSTTSTFANITTPSSSYFRATASGTLAAPIANGGFALTAGAASGNTLTLTGGISGLGGLVVGNSSSDTGTVALTTANTYQGNTTLSFGTLSLGNASALGSVGRLVFNGGTLDASTPLTVVNAITVSAAITFTGTAALTLSSAVALDTSRTVTVNGSTLTLSGVVSGATFKLTKAGTGTLKLTNTNTYSGGSDLGAGTTQAGAIQALGNSGTVTLTTSGATLQTLTAGFAGQNGKLTVSALNNAAGGIIKIGG